MWTVGLVGSRTHQFRRVQLSENDLGLLRIVETSRSFDGDPQLLKQAVQAYALGIAYEFDPYFGLSFPTSIRCRTNLKRSTITF